MSIEQAHPAVLSRALPGYEIGPELGRGAFGVVWAGRHRQLGRPVAIKQLDAPAEDANLRARFVSEARLMAALDHHNVVPLYDFVEAQGLCLLVMERLDGGTLRERYRSLTPTAACVVIVATCMGLHHAHTKGVLHRDVKPANLMLSADGVVKVTDFGIAKVLGGASATRTRAGALVGTPDYMAPEQVACGALSAATDVYAAGLILYELLAGAKPFTADDALAVMYQRVHGHPVPLLERAPNAPPPLAQVTARALRRDPAHRYASAWDLATAVSEAAGEQWGTGWEHDTDVSLGISLPVATRQPGRSAAASRSRGSGLIERESEEAAMREALASSRAGTGTLVVLEGAPGIGRTRLLSRAAELASADGHVVLRACGAQSQAGFAFGVVRRLLEPAVRSLTPERRHGLHGGAAGPALDLLEPAPSGVSSAEPDEGLLRGIHRVIVELAGRGPVLLVVDDAQWADLASLRALAYVARRLEDVAAMLAVAVQAGAVRLGSPLAAVLAAPGAIKVRLRSLDERGTQALVRELAGTGVDAEVGAACHAATRGNPFLISELLRAVRSAGGAMDVVTVEQVQARPPESLARSLVARLTSISGAAMPVAEAVAVLGDGAPMRHAALLAGLTESETLSAADALTGADVLLDDARGLSFAHPLVRSVVYGQLSANARGELHRRAAELLHCEGAETERVATQLLESPPGGDTDMANVLIAAATRAGERGASDTAARFLARALAEPPASNRVDEVRLQLGAADVVTGRLESATGHLRAALAGDLHGELRTRGAIGLANALFMASDVVGALAVLEQHKQLLDAQRALRLDVEQATLGLCAVEHAPAALRRMRSYRGLAGDSPTERLAQAMASVGISLDAAMTADDAATVALRALGQGRLLAEQTGDAPPHAMAIYVLLIAERVDAADAEVRLLRQDARVRGSRSAAAIASLAGASVSAARGELGSALAHAATGLERLLELPPSPLRRRWLRHAILVLVESFVSRGDLDGARVVVQRGEADVELAAVQHARAVLRLAEGDCEGALGDFLGCGQTCLAAGYEDRVVPWRGGAAEACARLGRTEEAVTMADEFQLLARAWGAPVGIARALRIRALAGAPAGSLALLTEAAELLDGSHARLEHARVLADRGVALRHAPGQDDADRTLRHALALAGACGATVLANRCQRELDEMAAGPRPHVL